MAGVVRPLLCPATRDYMRGVAYRTCTPYDPKTLKP